MEQINQVSNFIKEFILLYVPKLWGWLIILVVWRIVIAKLRTPIHNFLQKQESISQWLRGFLMSMTIIWLRVLLIIIAISTMWVETTSLIAALSALWLAVWLALQWSLSNIAWWIVLLFFKPLRVWEVVTINGETWTVSDIDLLYTTLRTFDRKQVFLPNSSVASTTIKNYSREDIIRIEIEVWIWYEADIKKAKEIITNIAINNKKVLSDPAVEVVVSGLWDNAVTIRLRAFTNLEDKRSTHHECLEDIKLMFDKEWVTMPFPQRTIWFEWPIDVRLQHE